MATLQDTKMQNWRIRSAELYKNEFAANLYGAMDFFIRQNDVPGAIVSPELRQRALGSIGNTIQVPVLKRNTTATVGTTRSCTNTNNETDSALVSLNWTTVTDGFTIVPNRYMNNDITEQQHFDANMMDMLRRIATKIDQLCLAALSTNKTSVIGDTLNYTFSSSTVSAAWTDRFDLLGDLNAMQISNKFYSGLNIIGNMGMLNIFNKLAEHDVYNAVNKRYEYADKNLYLTHQLSNASQKYGTFYCVPDGQVGILSRVSRPEYRGDSANEHSWGMTTLPYMGGLTFGTHFYTTVGDMTTITGNDDQVCDFAEHYTFSIDVALMTAYSSAAGTYGTPIIFGNVATGENGVTNVNVLSMPS